MVTAWSSSVSKSTVMQNGVPISSWRRYRRPIAPASSKSTFQFLRSSAARSRALGDSGRGGGGVRKSRAAHRAVVAVRGAEVVGAVGVLADQQIGAPLADLAGHVAADLARVLDLAVGIAQELHARDAERAGGVALLVGADDGQPLGRHRAVTRPLVAVGDDDIGDLAAVLDQLGHGAARAELGVVGVRGDDQRALDLVRHALSLI